MHKNILISSIPKNQGPALPEVGRDYKITGKLLLLHIVHAEHRIHVFYLCKEYFCELKIIVLMGEKRIWIIFTITEWCEP
jgi:hypothetical protein